MTGRAIVPPQLALRLGERVSIRFSTASLLVLACAALGVLGLIALGVGSGEYPLSAAQVIEALLGGGDERSRFVVWDLRLARLLAAVLVGVALGISGSIFQALARNPLVTPDVIGINTGAALAVVGVLVLSLPNALAAPAAFAGGMITAAALYLLSWRGGISGSRMVLIGIGIAAMAEAGIAYLFTQARLLEVQQATVWLVGSLYASSWADVLLLCATLAVLLPVAVMLGRRMVVLQLGDDVATALGVTIERTRLLLIVVAVGLAAVAVTAVGPIAFVAFLAPQIARGLARTSGAGELVASATVGALLVLGADIVSRRLFDPVELPVGIITVLLGGPYFLYLLMRSDRLGRGV